MTTFIAVFNIVEERSCPYYSKGESLIYHNRSVILPVGRPACFKLIRELTTLLFQLIPRVGSGFKEMRDTVYTCGGCEGGFIKFQLSETQQQKNIFAVDKGEVAVNGRLDTIPTVELMQCLHMHQKTGKLLLDVEQGTGEICFLNGSIIAAQFNKLEKQEAIFALMAETEGHFRFIPELSAALMQTEELEEFMALLLRGLKLLDEYYKS